LGAVAFSPDGKFLATGHGLGTPTPKSNTDDQRKEQAALKIWDLASSQFVVFDPDAPAFIRKMEWSHDSRYLVIVGADNTLRIYRPSESGIPIAIVPFDGTSVAFSPVGHEFAAAGGESVTIFTIVE
jgi:WD40 repeat protein